MKPSIPETGTVIRLDGPYAVIMMKGEKSCKGCGAAKIGLCRAGNASMFLTAGNALGAAVGDTVQVDLDRQVKRLGFSLAYVFPIASLIAGTLLGHVIGNYVSAPSLDVAAGFISLMLVSFLSFRRLKHLDRSHRLVIKKILSGGIFSEDVRALEETRYMG